MDWRIRQIVRMIVALLLQVLLIGHLQLLGVCHPYIYIVFLLMFPIRLPKIVDQLIGAGIGLVMDIFSNSLGTHMAACTLLMYARRIIIENIIMDYDRLSGEICSQTIGIENNLKYTAVLITLHHATVFLLSAWSWQHIGLTLLQIVVSTAISMALITGYDFIKK